MKKMIIIAMLMLVSYFGFCLGTVSAAIDCAALRSTCKTDCKSSGPSCLQQCDTNYESCRANEKSNPDGTWVDWVLGGTPLKNEVMGNIDPPVGTVGTGGEYGDVGEGGPVKFANAVINFLTAVAGIWLLIIIIINGIKIITSARTPEDFAGSVKKIMWSIVGMIIVALSFVIVRWISFTLFGSGDFITQPLDQIKPN